MKAFQFLLGGSFTLALCVAGAASAQAENAIPSSQIPQSSPADAAAPMVPGLLPDAGDVWDSAEGDYGARPWTFSADGMIFQRSSPDSLALFRTEMFHDGEVARNANDLDFSTSGGWRIGAIRDGRDCDLEISYFQLDGFEAHATAAGEVYMVSDRDGAHLAIIAPWLEYRSRLYNAEFNVRRPRNEWLTLMAGFRLLELDEHYRVAGLSDEGIPVDEDEYLVTFSQRANNHLYGFQIGADGLLLCRNRFSIQGLLKAGVYLNHAEQSGVQFDDHPNGGTYDAHGRVDTAAFVGELGLLGKYRLSQRLAVRLGYQLMWLDGVATATDQIAVNDFGIGNGDDTGGVDTGNTVFYHGAVIGAEMTW